MEKWGEFWEKSIAINRNIVSRPLNNFFEQLKDWVGQVLFLVSCPKGQVEKYVNVEACIQSINYNTLLLLPANMYEELLMSWH
jgi:hypothetical protein